MKLLIPLCALATSRQLKTDRQDEMFDHMDGGILDSKMGADVDKMTEEEKVEQLLEIVKKIDTNKDQFLEEGELKRWMQKTSDRYMQEDINNQFPGHDTNNDGVVSWKEYEDSVFGFMTSEDFQEQKLTKDQMISRDKRRFESADLDKTDSLDNKEFGAFLHPEDHTHMRAIVVSETLEDLDKNADGQIDQNEYISDMYHPDNEDEEEPEWLKIEIEHFRTIRDKDGDGFLNHDEVRDWLLPVEYDHIEAEAQHLVSECDTDDDAKLSYDEVLKKYDVFITSQATNWGEALSYHDEL
jgi:Ca2+-binding EF-hand superfamily protein